MPLSEIWGLEQWQINRAIDVMNKMHKSAHGCERCGFPPKTRTPRKQR